MVNTIYIAGHNGMVGSSLVRALDAEAGVEVITRNRSELDLCDQAKVRTFFANNKIDQVYLAAAHVGGIYANNTRPADFIYQNLMIQSNVVDAAYQAGVKSLLLLGSSCIYPRLANQPMEETELLTGELEPTNEPYAIAKIAGIKLCESYNRQYDTDYRSVMPTNLYGENDNFHPEQSHVVPAILRRFHEAKLNQQSEVSIWGSGQPKREFLYVDDMAEACIHVMNLSKDSYNDAVDERLSHINIGTGVDCTIKELALTVAKVVEYSGSIVFDETKPDGAPRKLLSVDRINSLGWQSTIDLESGLRKTYDWFLSNKASAKGF